MQTGSGDRRAGSVNTQRAADNLAETWRKQKPAAQIVSRLIIQAPYSLSNDPGKEAQII